MRKLLSAALALSACVLMVAATAAFAARAETKVTIKAESGGFFGYVKSEKNKCANGRKVTLYKLKGNGYDRKNDEKIGSDIAQANGDKYMWSTGNTGSHKGDYYAYAKKINGCKADYSKVIEAQK